MSQLYYYPEKDVLDLVGKHAPDPGVASLLGRMAKSNGRAAVPVLAKLLSSDDKETAVAAVTALAEASQLARAPQFVSFLARIPKIGPSAIDPVVSVFSTLGRDASLQVLSSPRRFLADPRSGRRSEALSCLLFRPRPRTPESVAIVNDPDVMGALEDCLTHEKGDVRGFAVLVLLRHRTPSTASHLLEKLPRLLRDSDRFVRHVALWAVRDLGEEAASPAMIEMVIERLAYADNDLAAEAADALAALGSLARTDEVLSRLFERVKRAAPGFKASALPLARFAEAPDSSEIVRLLLDQLAHERAAVRAEVLLALGRSEKTAARPEVIAAASARLDDPAAEVRAAAATALGGVKDRDAAGPLAEPLRKALSDEDARVRAAAAAALDSTGLAAAVPSLREVLLARVDDPDPGVRRAAVTSIEGYGPAGADTAVVEALTLRLDDPDKLVRLAAARALHALGSPAAKPATLEALARHLQSKAPVAEGAAEALKHLSAVVAAPDRSRALSLFAALAQRPAAAPRDVGCVGLRNVLGTSDLEPRGKDVTAPRHRDRPVPTRDAARLPRRPR